MALDLKSGNSARLPGTRILVWVSDRSERVAGLELWRRAVYTACRAGFERILIIADRLAGEIGKALADDHRLDGRHWEVLRPGDDWVGRIRSAGGRWVTLSDHWIVDSSHLRELASLFMIPDQPQYGVIKPVLEMNDQLPECRSVACLRVSITSSICES